MSHVRQSTDHSKSAGQTFVAKSRVTECACETTGTDRAVSRRIHELLEPDHDHDAHKNVEDKEVRFRYVTDMATLQKDRNE